MRHTPDAKGVSLTVLGRFAVHVDGAEIEVSRPQVRQFLALLAADADRFVSVDRIEEDLWPDSLPRSPKSALQVIVSRARALLGEAGSSIIRAEPGSYRLSLEGCEVDLDQWYRRVAAARRLAAAGRYQHAVKEFAAARAIWGGEPFIGIPESRALERERARIVQSQGDVDLDEAAALASVGEHAAAARILEETSVREPLREDVARARMLALHRASRTADALRVAAAFRETLREQLGASPTPSFDSDEQALLNFEATGQDQRIRSVRRRAEWWSPLVDAVVAQVRDELSSPSPEAVFLTAAPRYGLSTCLARVVEGVHDAVPDAVVHHIHHGSGIDHSLHRLVEALELPLDALTLDRPTLVVDALSERAAESPVVVVIDDADELDGWSIRLVELLMSGLPPATSVVMGTHEGSATGAAPPTAAHTYALSPFDVGDTERLVTELVPDMSADARRRVAHRITAWCNGDPTSTQAAVEFVAEHGEDARLPLVRDEAERIESRLRSLDEPCRELVTKGAVLGDGIDCLLLSELTGEPTEVIIGRIGLAAATGLVTRASKPGWWSFADAQTREVLASHVDQPTVHALHLDAAQVVLTEGKSRAQAALHLIEALPLGDPAVAARTALEGGNEQLREHRYESAAYLLRTAAELFADRTAALEAKLGEALALERLGDHGRADEIYGQIVEDPVAVDGDLLARAALGGASRASRIGGQPRRRRRLGIAYRRMRVGDPFADEVAAELALEELNAGVPSTPGIRERLEQIADDDASPGQLLALRVLLVMREIEQGADVELARKLARLALSSDSSTGSPHPGAALAVACQLALVAGDWVEAESLIDEFELYGRRSGDPRSRWQAVAFRAALTEARGAHAAADALSQQAHNDGLRLGIADADAAAVLHHIGRAFRNGSLATFTSLLGAIEERYRVAAWHAIRGLAELDAGAGGTARTLLREALDSLERGRDVFRPPAVALTCLLAARLGRPAEIASVCEDLDKRSGRFVFLGYGGPFLAPVDWFRAEVSRAAGDAQRATELAATARTACLRVGASVEMFGP